MQQSPPMMPVMPSFAPANITTEQIQKYLDENKKLILAILDNQNLGKLAECAQYQAQLQKNLMYLAAIADAQPQMPTMPAQMSPHPSMQPSGAGQYYMQQQHPQAAAAAAGMAAQQPGVIFPPRMPMQFTSPPPPGSHPFLEQQLQQQQQQLHHQQAVSGQISARPGGPGNGMQQMMHHGSEAAVGGSSGGNMATQTKQDTSRMGPGGDGGGGNGEGSYPKGTKET